MGTSFLIKLDFKLDAQINEDGVPVNQYVEDKNTYENK